MKKLWEREKWKFLSTLSYIKNQNHSYQWIHEENIRFEGKAIKTTEKFEKEKIKEKQLEAENWKLRQWLVRWKCWSLCTRTTQYVKMHTITMAKTIWIVTVKGIKFVETSIDPNQPSKPTRINDKRLK